MQPEQCVLSISGMGPSVSDGLTMSVWRTMVLTVLAWALVSLIAAENLRAASIAEVMNNIRRQRQAADFRAEGRIVQVDGQGARTSHRFTLKGKYLAQSLKLLWDVPGPKSSWLKLLIESFDGGQIRIRLAGAADSSIKELMPQQWGDPFLGSALIYEDLIDGHLVWRTQELLREEKYGARNCYVIQSLPGPGEPSAYATVTSWIDRTIYVPVYVEKVLRKSGAKRTFVHSGLRQSKGVWGARQVEVRDAGGSLAYLTLTRGSGKANLRLNDFDPRVLLNKSELGSGRNSIP